MTAVELLDIAFALRWEVLLLAIGYGFVETNLACHAGAWVVARRPAASKRRP